MIKISIFLISMITLGGCKSNEIPPPPGYNNRNNNQKPRDFTPEQVEQNKIILKKKAVEVVKNSDFDFEKRKTLGYSLFALDKEGELFNETISFLENIPIEKRNESDKKTLSYLKGLTKDKN